MKFNTQFLLVSLPFFGSFGAVFGKSSDNMAKCLDTCTPIKRAAVQCIPNLEQLVANLPSSPNLNSVNTTSPKLTRRSNPYGKETDPLSSSYQGRQFNQGGYESASARESSSASISGSPNYGAHMEVSSSSSSSSSNLMDLGSLGISGTCFCHQLTTRQVSDCLDCLFPGQGQSRANTVTAACLSPNVNSTGEFKQLMTAFDDKPSSSNKLGVESLWIQSIWTAAVMVGGLWLI